MEMQLFILGHVLLLAVCLFVSIVVLKIDAITVLMGSNAKENERTVYTDDLKPLELYLLWLGQFGVFEIIYWLLHWMFVGF